jgi:hypothetical protein
METNRNHLISDAYASMYLQEETEQIDEIAPIIAAGAGKLASMAAGKAATAGAAKVGGGLAKAASSKLGQKAISAGSQAVGNKVQSSLSKEEVEDESYTSAYMEGYKNLPAAKMQDKAYNKPDTARGESQARKMDMVRRATRGNEDLVKSVTKGQEMSNRKKGLERKYNAPSADDASEKARKNKAYKLENQRRQDLNKRYGPKKEEYDEMVLNLLIDENVSLDENSAFQILTHMSDEWYEAIVEEILSEKLTPEERESSQKG